MTARKTGYLPARDMTYEEIDAKFEAMDQRTEEFRSRASSLLRIVADLRFALGDDGERMQPELIAFAKEMRRDAEAFRKMVELGLNVEPGWVTWNSDDASMRDFVEPIDNDPIAATRRAIDLAAAAIGASLS